MTQDLFPDVAADRTDFRDQTICFAGGGRFRTICVNVLAGMENLFPFVPAETTDGADIAVFIAVDLFPLGFDVIVSGGRRAFGIGNCTDGAGVNHFAVFSTGRFRVGGHFVLMRVTRTYFVDRVPAGRAFLQEMAVAAVGSGRVFNDLIIVPLRRDGFGQRVDFAGVSLTVQVVRNLADVFDKSVFRAGCGFASGLPPVVIV